MEYDVNINEMERAEEVLAVQYRRAATSKAWSMETRASTKLKEANHAIQNRNMGPEQKQLVAQAAAKCAEEAIGLAREAGLSTQVDRLDKAVRDMRNAWRSLARERLQQVLTSTDVEQNLSELRAALAEGEFADLGSSDATEE